MQGNSTTRIGIKIAKKHKNNPCRYKAETGITNDTEAKFECLGTSKPNF